MLVVRNILILLILSFFGLTGSAQSDTLATDTTQRRELKENEGIIKFFVEVNNGYFEVLINDTLLLKRFKDTLPVGHYSAKVWSPGYVTVPIEFDVEAKQTTKKHVKMVYTNEKQQFESDYKDYRMKFHKNLSLPGCITLASTLATGSFMLVAYDLQNKLKEDIELYGNASKADEIDVIKARVEKRNRNYNILRTSFYVGAGVSVLMLGTTIYTYSRFKKNNAEPTFRSKSPWHDRFSLNISPFGGRIAWRIG